MRHFFHRLVRPRRLLLALFKKEHGATMIEFALVAPFALILILAVIELAAMMLAQNILETATFAASRSGMTGYVDAGKTRDQSIRDILNQRAGSLLDVNKVTITSKTYNSFSKIGDPEPFVDANGNGVRDNGENYTDVNGNGVYDTDQGANGQGGAKVIVLYTVSYPWKIFTPVIGQMMGLTNGQITLTSRAVIKNEPFSVN